MKLNTKTCLSHIVYLLSKGEVFSSTIDSFNIVKQPNFNLEGFNGYIETEVEFNIRSLVDFAKVFDSWYLLSTETRNKLYSLAKGTYNI